MSVLVYFKDKHGNNLDDWYMDALPLVGDAMTLGIAEYQVVKRHWTDHRNIIVTVAGVPDGGTAL